MTFVILIGKLVIWAILQLYILHMIGAKRIGTFKKNNETFNPTEINFASRLRCRDLLIKENKFDYST